ncbi:MAG: cytochrome c oxidase subunit 3 [Saprospiraceae bacterium]|nr:cytochrome c oxidase subunit 3 [Saprospiraceae bacterium]
MASTDISHEIDWKGGNRPFQARYGKLMMWYFLVSDAFTFTTFLVTYGLIRFSSTIWPDPNQVFNAMPFLHGVKVPLGFVSIMTFILILSSVFVVRAVQEGHRLNKNGVLKWMGLGILGGIAFLGCQAWEWSHMHHEGMWFDRNSLQIVPKDFSPTGEALTLSPAALEEAIEDGLFTEAQVTEMQANGQMKKAPVNFTNLFFFITGFHGLHVLSGIILNIIAWINTAKGVYQRRKDYEMIEKMGLYWHFVDLVWVFVFLCFYLL